MKRDAEAAHNQAAWLAWHVAALSRQKKLPKLGTLLAKRKPKRRQTPDEMLAMCKMLTVAMGGEVVDRLH